MTSFRDHIKRTYALSDKGVSNMYKGMAWTVVVNFVVLGSITFLYLLMGQFVKTLVEGASLPSFAAYLLAILAFAIVSFFCHLMQYHYTYSVVYEEVGAMRISIAERLRKLPLSFFSHRDLAELTETIMADVNRMEHVWSHVLAYLYGSFVSTAIAAAGMAFMDWRLALATLWGVPVAFGLLFGSRSLSVPRSRRTKAAALAVSDNVQELAETMREIRATNQERRYLDALYERIDRAEALTVETEAVNGLFVNAAAIIMRLGIATTVLVGAQSVLAGRIDFMTFFMFLLVITRIYAPFDQSLALISEVFLSETSVARLQEVLETPAASGSESFAPKGYDIVFDHVGFAYAADAVLQDVSFIAREGEVTALVGPSGSGKSTCARLAARLWDHSAGSLTVGDVEVLDVDPETLMSAFSMVFQDVTLFDDTVMENIRLGRSGATDEEVLAAAAAANCDEFVSRLPEGYRTLIGENGARLSGGERQRISIARALLKDAPIVLLDEATASLDVENETRVQAALSRLLQGRTVLVIAHRMRTVMGADKVVVLDGGKVVEQGAPAELLSSNGVFARMVRLQSESSTWSL